MFGDYSDQRLNDTAEAYGKSKEESTQHNEVIQFDGRSKNQFPKDKKLKKAITEKEDPENIEDYQTSESREEFENGTRSESTSFTNQTLLDEPRRPDMNETLHDSEDIFETEDKKSESKPLGQNEGQNVSHDTVELVEGDSEVSGNQASEESGDNTSENKGDEEVSSSGEVSDVSISDYSEGSSAENEEGGSAANIDENRIINATDGDNEQEVEFNRAADQHSFEESEAQLDEGHIRKHVIVNFMGNHIVQENKSEPNDDETKTRKLDPEDSVVSTNVTDDSLFDSASGVRLKNGTDVESQEVDVNKAGKATKETTNDESKHPVKQVIVNFAGNNLISANQSESSFDRLRSKKSNSENIVDATNSSEDRLLDRTLLNEFNQSADVNGFNQRSLGSDGNGLSNNEIDRPITQPLNYSSQNILSEESLDQSKPNSKDVADSTNSQKSPLDHELLQEANLSSNSIGTIQNFTAKDVDVDGFPNAEFETPMTNPKLNESLADISETNAEGDTKRGGSEPFTNQLHLYDRQNDVDLLDKPEQMTSDENDQALVGQDSLEESSPKQDNNNLKIDNTTLPEHFSSNSTYLTALNSESTQLTNMRETKSQENGTMDETDDIPVYTVSMPSGVDSVSRESTGDDKLSSQEFPVSSIDTAVPNREYMQQSTLPREAESTFNSHDISDKGDGENKTNQTQSGKSVFFHPREKREALEYCYCPLILQNAF